MPVQLDGPYVDAMRTVLRHPALDAAFKDLVLTLPAETYIAEQLDVVDPQRIHAVREEMRQQLAQALYADWNGPSSAQGQRRLPPDPVSSGRRALAGPGAHPPVPGCVRAATPCGRASLPALQGRLQHDRPLQRAGGPGGERPRAAAQALQRFHAMFKGEALVLDKWFALQAGAPDRGGNILPIVKYLMQHPDFNIRNPNRARSVIFSYCSGNPAASTARTRPAMFSGASA